MASPLESWAAIIAWALICVAIVVLTGDPVRR